MSAPATTRSRAARQQPAGAARSTLAGLDYPLIAILATLLALGLVEVYSASVLTNGSHFFTNQIMWTGIGIAIMVLMTAIPYRFWQRAAVPLMVVTLILLIAVLLVGTDLYGARRTLFGGRLQPSEIAKLAIVTYVAAWVASKKEHLREVRGGLVPFAVVMGIVAGLIVLEHSFSVTIIILVTGVTIFFLGGGDLKQLLITAIIAAVVLLLLIYEFHYGVDRIQGWWQTLVTPENAPYTTQQVHNMILKGGGIGTRPENWLNKQYVPLLWSDYLFANLAADFKFPGAVAVVVLFAALGYRGLSIALSAPDEFGALAGIGVTTWMLTQAIIHMGASVALIPATGIPLPFMSYGGSAMVASMAGMGLLLSISRATPEKRNPYASFGFGWGNRRPRVSDSGRRGGTAGYGPASAEQRSRTGKPAARTGSRGTKSPAPEPAGTGARKSGKRLFGAQARRRDDERAYGDWRELADKPPAKRRKSLFNAKPGRR